MLYNPSNNTAKFSFYPRRNILTTAKKTEHIPVANADLVSFTNHLVEVRQGTCDPLAPRLQMQGSHFGCVAFALLLCVCSRSKTSSSTSHNHHNHCITNIVLHNVKVKQYSCDKYNGFLSTRALNLAPTHNTPAAGPQNRSGQLFV